MNDTKTIVNKLVLFMDSIMISFQSIQYLYCIYIIIIIIIIIIIRNKYVLFQYNYSMIKMMKRWVFYNLMFKRISYWKVSTISPPVLGYTPLILWSVDVSDINSVNS